MKRVGAIIAFAGLVINICFSSACNVLPNIASDSSSKNGNQVDLGLIEEKNGNSFLTGYGAPTIELGEEGDSYLDLDSWNYYIKHDATWVLKCNIKGSDGSSGYVYPIEHYTDNTEIWMDDYYRTHIEDAVQSKASPLKPLITFIDDDGSSLFKATVQPILEEKHIPFVLAVPTNKCGLSIDDLDYLKSKGCEIVSHTHNHLSLASLSESEIESEFVSSKIWLQKHNYSDDILVFPNGSHNELVRKIAKKYFRCAIDISEGYNTLPIHQFSMNRFAFCDPRQSNWDLKDYTSAVDEAIKNSSWLIFKVHCHYNTFSASLLSELIDYIKNAGIEITTISKGLAQYGNMIEVGDYSQQSNSRGGFAIPISQSNVLFLDNKPLIDASASVYDTNLISSSFYDDSDIATSFIPNNKGGLMYTMKCSVEKRIYQILFQQTTNDIFIRIWIDDILKWSDWKCISPSIIVKKIQKFSFPSLDPFGGAFDVSLSIPIIDHYSGAIFCPQIIPEGVSFNVIQSGSNVITVRATNVSNKMVESFDSFGSLMIFK